MIDESSQVTSRPGPLSVKPQRAFSLLEATVTLLVMVQVAFAIMVLFNQTNNLSRAQNNVSMMQQLHRMAQHEIATFTRMAGAGGLPQGVPVQTGEVGGYAIADPTGTANVGSLPKGLGVTVLNDFAPSVRAYNVSDPDTRNYVQAGSDMLILRGQVSEQTYYLPPQPLTDADGDGTYLVQIPIESPGGVPQDLEDLRATLNDVASSGDAYPEAIIVRDTLNPSAYAVMEIDLGDTVVGLLGQPITLGVSLASGSTQAQAYGHLTRGTSLLLGSGGDTVNPGGGPAVQLPANVGSIGILEEYRYFIREEFDVAGDNTSRLTPSLERARVYPGTNILHREGSVTIADNILDLQLALGVDHLLDGLAADGATPALNGLITEDGSINDEVLYNNAGDNDGLGSSLLVSPWAGDGASLHFLRISTVAQTDRPDRELEIPVLSPLEDRMYDPTSELMSYPTRKRVLTTVIDFRNIP